MSIITNALKKAQEKHLQNQNKPIPSGNNPSLNKETLVQKMHHELVAHPKIFPVLLTAVIIFGCVAGVLLYMPHFSMTSEKPQAISKETAKKIENRDRPSQKTPIVANVDTRAKPGKKDFIPRASIAETKSVFNPAGKEDIPTLSGIMYAPTLHQAILNGRPVSEGSTIDGVTVLKIYPDSVIISSGDEKTELKLR